MKICEAHWEMCKKAVESRGLWPLVSADGEEASRRIQKELECGISNDTFDPLISMSMHFCNAALEEGGLYLMGNNEDGSNEGHYCPICEYQSHCDIFVDNEEIESVADQMRKWCLEEGMIGKAS